MNLLIRRRTFRILQVAIGNGPVPIPINGTSKIQPEEYLPNGPMVTVRIISKGKLGEVAMLLTTATRLGSMKHCGLLVFSAYIRYRLLNTASYRIRIMMVKIRISITPIQRQLQILSTERWDT